MSYEDSGTFQTLRQRRGPSKDAVGEWLTWAVRALIPVICWFAWEQNQAMQAMEITIAKMSMQQDYQTQQLTDHARQLQQLWQQYRARP